MSKLEILLRELKKVQAENQTCTLSDGSEFIIQGGKSNVKNKIKNKIPTDKPIKSLIKYQDSSRLEATAREGKLFIGTKAQVRWNKMKNDKELEKRKQDNQRLLNELGLGRKKNVIKITRPAVMATVINFEAFRKAKTKRSTETNSGNLPPA